MAGARILQTNFTAGELSPRLIARPDLERYAAGAAELYNVLVQPQGGCTKRPGSYFVAGVKDEQARVRLVAFTVSTIAAYVLEFGAGYVRFFRNRAQITAAGVPIEVATPYATADLRSLRFTQSADVLYVCHPSHQPRKISRTGVETFTISVVDFADGPYQAENTGDVGPAGSTGSTTDPGDGTGGGSTGGSDTGGDPDPGGDGLGGGGGGSGGGE